MGLKKGRPIRNGFRNTSRKNIYQLDIMTTKGKNSMS
jgi:hypothetical protein